MAEKEERILIARSTDYTLTDTDKGELFEGKIAPHCANVFTRQEAIDVMAKSICAKDFAEEFKEDCGKCACRNEKECSLVIEVSKYIKLAEAALNALLEGSK